MFNQKKIIQARENIKGPCNSTITENERLSIKQQVEQSSLPRFEIESTSLAFCSKDFIDKQAVVSCKDKTDRDSINDPRMCPLSDAKRCCTCELTRIECPGHIGKIDLPIPVINPMAIFVITTLLQIFCNSCGGILQEPVEPILNMKKLKEFAKKCIKISCNRFISCKSNPRYETPNSERNGFKITYVYTAGSKDVKSELDISHVIRIFNSIAPEEMEMLGFNKKTLINDFIMYRLVVIPEINRPTNYRDGLPRPDDFTEHYSSIIRRADKTKNSIDNNIPVDIEKNYKDMEDDIYKMIDSKCRKQSKDLASADSSRDSTKDKLSGKEGYFRKYAMGKRVNFSGRTILGSGQVVFGFMKIPNAMKNLTTRVKVSASNIDYLKDLYSKGEILYHNTNIGRFKYMPDVQRVIRIGDVVERAGMDGDEFCFNRQPTLHKHSFMGYYVRHDPLYTIRIHSSVTTPHNADFDGDEATIHKPQSLHSRAEIRHLVGCWNNLIGAQASKPMMGIVYNGVSAGYLLSLYEKEFSDYEWDFYTSFLQRKDRLETLYSRMEKLGFTDKQNGRCLISLLVPSNFYYSHAGVTFKNGILVSGTLKKSHLEPVDHSIVHLIAKKYGNQEAARFLTEAQLIFDVFLCRIGFTIGVYDCSVNPSSQQELKQTINNKIVQIENEVAKTVDLENTKASKRRTETKTIDILNVFNNLQLDKYLRPDSTMKTMIVSGAKGNSVNVLQILGGLGQQFLKGERPTMEISEGTRCLPYFPASSNDIRTRGFIDHSFSDGLTPDQMIFHMQASRIGLIDTAIRTAETGFMHHRISKVMEDTTNSYDGTMSTTQGKIFRFYYHDGYGAEHLISNSCPGIESVGFSSEISDLIAGLNSED